MRTAVIRYETPFSSAFTRPFELGMRHLQVAFSNGAQDSLKELAKERIIYRPYAPENTYAPLGIGQRVFHLIVGGLETGGYLTLAFPFIASVVDKSLNKPWYPKGSYAFRTHMEEGGLHAAYFLGMRRKNPFDLNGVKDPFYRGASWVQA